MERIMIACPKGVQTGGPEALHQLAKSLRMFNKNCFLWDPDKVRAKSQAAFDFANYGDLWLNSEPENEDVVILPEIMSSLIPKFYEKNIICFWWLSVDNFISTNNIPIDVIKELYPKIFHLYQSEYANQFLIENGLLNKVNLSDYINPDFIAQPSKDRIDSELRHSEKFTIAINPSKGFSRTELLLKKLDNFEVIRLENMSRSKVIESLGRSNFYVDLGDHPGMDRIPREAALLGCVILTNLRGAASNDIDVPIDKNTFKFDDSKPGFEIEIAKKINEISNNFDEYFDKQKNYREFIKSQKSKFIDEVKHLNSYLQTIKFFERGDELENIRFFVYQQATKNSELIDELSNVYRLNAELQTHNNELKNEIRRILSSKTWKLAKFISKFIRAFSNRT